MAALGAQVLNQIAAAELVADENGVMMYRYGGSIGTVYNPKVVALEGLRYSRTYEITGEPVLKEYHDRFAAYADD